MRQAIPKRAISGLFLYAFFNLLASFCFKECAADTAHTWHYFIAGNTFGPLSLIFLMWVYSGMNANMASALTMGLCSISVQVAFWLVYHVSLTRWQWAGVAVAILGAIIAVSGRPSPQSATVSDAGLRSDGSP